MTQYTSDPAPGTFDHRGGDCDTHGVNVAVFRLKGAIGPYFCVQCALELLNSPEQDLASGEE